MINVSGWTLKPPSTFSRLVFFVLLSGVMMLLDHRGHHLDRIRAGLNILAYPVQIMADFPVRASKTFGDFFGGKGELQQRYDELHNDHLILLGRLQTYETLEAENEHLRELLGAGSRLPVKATIAELLEVSPEPFTRKILLTKGSADGVFKGQALVDAYGVIGRITEVDIQTSKATLITDSSHSIPVQVVRNGLRAIVFGTGTRDEVDVPYLTPTADIQVNDILVSSGLGGTFPAGYPVARVMKVVTNPNESFLKITARPLARLEHNKEVLLIRAEEHAKPVKSSAK